MKNYGCFIAAVLGVVFTVSYATINGNYSVNVHFIPALVRGPCPFGQLWNPPNITCASCYCLTGQLSRCGPRPGCNPTANATATTTTTTPAAPGGVTGMMTMPTVPATAMGNQNPTTQSSVNPPPTGASAAASSPTPAGSPAPTSVPVSTAGTAASAATTPTAASTPAPPATTIATNKFRRGGRR